MSEADYPYALKVPQVIAYLSGKWKLTILWYLSQSGWFFSHLKRELMTVSASVLTTQLRELERDGLIRRKKYHTAGKRTYDEYVLTPLGERLQPIFKVIKRWKVNPPAVNSTIKKQRA